MSRLVRRRKKKETSASNGKRTVHRRSKDSLRKSNALKGLRNEDKPKGADFYKKHNPKWANSWWKPGQSGNPKGRPKNRVYIVELIKKYLNQVADPETGITYEALAAKALVEGILRLNPTAIKEVMGRAAGPLQRLLQVEGHSSMDISVGELARRLADKTKKKTDIVVKNKRKKSRRKKAK